MTMTWAEVEAQRLGLFVVAKLVVMFETGESPQAAKDAIVEVLKQGLEKAWREGAAHAQKGGTDFI